MVFGQWKPQEVSEQSKAFYENQHVSFLYRKVLFAGKIEKLLVNSAIVLLPLTSPSAFQEKTVIQYNKLIIV
ncbi:hypothetical protein [Enterococcus sp. 5H]|uniref:hypothetical protein n=1 Tax=Enterococcus sp. 5H TaxID=1229490 RepID=UPI0023021B60|nr:hypothetical protein [Enterococcus sp. 5H]MDA9472030.1 hypothetical protein [Enterococcus sp. 5H]